MRLTFLFLTVGFLHVGAKSVSQTISFSGNAVSLLDVFAAVKQQTGYVVFYDNNLLKDSKPVSLSVKDKPLSSFLSMVLDGQSLGFSIKKRTIVIKPLSLSPSHDNVYSPPVPIRIRVVDADGNPLSGASIINQNTKNSGVTDAGGVLSLNVSVNDVLEISFVGYESQSITVKDNSSTLTIVLKPSDSKLDQVTVNAGYYDVNEKEMTGNISRVTAETISKQPVSNPLQALQARIPGMYIQQSTGIPGGSFSIQIRGQNSLRRGGDNGNGNLPLYIIDGVPFSSSQFTAIGGGVGSPTGVTDPLNSINIADIDHIEVLKDADATAIYGSRGSNGVVLITTKKGKSGKTKVELNVYTGIAKVGRMMDLLNTQQYLMIRKEALVNDGLVASSDPSDSNGANGKMYAPDLLLWDTTRYTDWQEKLIGGTSNITSAQLSLSGGNDNTQFLISGGYFSEGTVFPGDFKDEKGSGHLHLSHISDSKKFKADASISFFLEKNNLPKDDVAERANRLQPNAPAIYDESGELNWENDTWDNPYAALLTRYQYSTDNLITNVNLSYEIFPGLRLKSVLGYNIVYFTEFSKKPLQALRPISREGGVGRAATLGTNRIETWIVEPQAEYERSIGKGKLALLIGGTFQKNSKEGLYLRGSGFVSDAAMDNIQAAPELVVNTYSTPIYKYAAVFGRFNFNWCEKYILNLTGRRDGSSRFGPNKKFANFGAVGVAWLFSEEAFIKHDLRFLSFGKVRGSYGVTGSDAIPDYRFLDTYSSTSTSYNGNVGLYPTRIANDDFSWEVNKKLEVALDLGFLNDRVSLAISWYQNLCSNQLVDYTLSAVTGQQGISANLPATVQNTGFEFELLTKNLQSSKLTWATSFNISVPRNKLVSYPNIEASTYANTYVVGQSLNIVKAYIYTGIDPRNGLYTLKDINSDGIISPEYDQKFINVGRQYYGGLQNSLQYNGFQLDILLQFVKQTARDWLHRFPLPGAYNNGTNQPVEVLSRWREEGDKTSVQRFSTLPENYIQYSYFRDSDRALTSDGSFIRLKNISLSYQIPSHWVVKIGLSSLRVYMLGQNLLTLTNYRGIDPDQGFISWLPPLLSFTGGVQLTL